jgi:hypothetical protein
MSFWENVETDEHGGFVDGVRPYIGNYVNHLFAVKNDHSLGSECRVCHQAGEAGADGWACYASLGPVSDADLDHWVKYGAANDPGFPEFYDHRQTREGRDRWREYVAKDRAEWREKRQAEREEKEQ